MSYERSLTVAHVQGDLHACQHFFQEMFHDNATRQRVGHAHEVKIACARGTYTCRPQLLEARLTTSNLRRRHRHRRHRRCRPPSSSSSSLPAAPPARTMVYKSCVLYMLYKSSSPSPLSPSSSSSSCRRRRWGVPMRRFLFLLRGPMPA